MVHGICYHGIRYKDKVYGMWYSVLYKVCGVWYMVCVLGWFLNFWETINTQYTSIPYFYKVSHHFPLLVII